MSKVELLKQVRHLLDEVDSGKLRLADLRYIKKVLEVAKK